MNNQAPSDHGLNDEPEQNATPSFSAVQSLLIWMGGGALLLVVLVETLAVLGPFVGVPFLGVLEIVEGLVLISGGVAMIVTCLAQAHARVHLLLERISLSAKQWLDRFASCLSILFIIACAHASFMNARAMFGSFEQSEVLHIPHAPLRAILIVILIWMALIYVEQLLGSLKISPSKSGAGK